jgi:hypothetical protein
MVQSLAPLLLLLLGAAADGASLGLTLRARLADGAAAPNNTYHDAAFGPYTLPDPVYRWVTADAAERAAPGARVPLVRGQSHVDSASRTLVAALARLLPELEMMPPHTQRSTLMPCAEMFNSCAYHADDPVRTSARTFFVGEHGLCMLREASPLVHQLIKQGLRSFALRTMVFRPDAEDHTHMPVFSQLDVVSIDSSAVTTVAELQAQAERGLPLFLDRVMQVARLAVPSVSLRWTQAYTPEAAYGTGFDIVADMRGTSFEIASGGMKSLEALRAAGLVQGNNVYGVGGHVSFGLERVAMVLNGTTKIRDVSHS